MYGFLFVSARAQFTIITYIYTCIMPKSSTKQNTAKFRKRLRTRARERYLHERVVLLYMYDWIFFFRPRSTHQQNDDTNVRGHRIITPYIYIYIRVCIYQYKSCIWWRWLRNNNNNMWKNVRVPLQRRWVVVLDLKEKKKENEIWKKKNIE